jgi:drug/metabolite transporter (DMT)-like permease
MRFSDKQPAWLPYFLLALTALFWSGNFVLGRGVRELIPPVSLNFWRWAGALSILLPFSWPRLYREREMLWRHWKLLALMSIPSICIFNTFIYTALQTATTTNTVLLNAMTPIFIGVTARIAFGVRMQRLQVAGVLISLAGLMFIITHGDWSALAGLTFTRGDIWTLGAALAWAIYSVMLRLRPMQMAPLTFLTAIIAIGLFLLLPFYLWELSVKGGFELSAASMASLAYVCIFPSVLAYIFWNHGVDQVGANRAGLFSHLMPVYSILLASILLGERLHVYHLIGIVLIFGGILLNNRPARRV